MDDLPPELRASMERFLDDLRDQAQAMVLLMVDQQDLHLTDDEVQMVQASVSVGAGVMMKSLSERGVLDTDLLIRQLEAEA